MGFPWVASVTQARDGAPGGGAPDPPPPPPETSRPLRDVLDDVESAAGWLWHAAPAAAGALLDAVPQATAPPGAMSAQQVGVLVRSVRAQREQVRALQGQLAVVDEQLGVLEGMLAPLSAVVDTWAAVERAVGGIVPLDRLVAALRAVVPHPDAANPGPSPAP